MSKYTAIYSTFRVVENSYYKLADLAANT